MEQKMPLSGVRVVELATVVAAPTVGRMMAAYGAEVIKVETLGGDGLRPFGKGHCLPTENGNSPLFDLYNSGKEFVSLNLKTEQGQEIFHRLLSSADVFLTNVRYKGLARMGLDYETLKEKYPRLVYAHFSGFGLNGPDADRPGYDMTAFWMRSGALLDWLLPNSFPMRPTFGFGDVATASAFLSGIMMALYSRTNTGRGTMVSTSLLSSGIWCNSTYVLNAQEPYNRPYPMERYDPWNPFAEWYQCSDGKWVAVFEKRYATDRFIFAELFDFPELAEDPDLEDLTKMRQSGKLPMVTKRVSEAFLKKPSQEWLKILAERDIPSELQVHLKDVCKDQQAWANGSFDKVEYPDGAKVAMPAPPIVFPEFQRKEFSINQSIGEDTDNVLRRIGYSEAEITDLHDQKIVR